MDVLTYIKNYTAEHGRAPSYREIGRACGIASTAAVKRAIDELIIAGKLARTEGARGLRVLGCDTEAVTAGRWYVGVCYTCRKTYKTDAASRMEEWIQNHKDVQ